MIKSIKNKLIQWLGGYTEEELAEQGVEFVDNIEDLEKGPMQELQQVESAPKQKKIENLYDYDLDSPLHPESVPLSYSYKNDSSALEFRLLNPRKLFTEDEYNEKLVRVFERSKSSTEIVSEYYNLNNASHPYFFYKELLVDLKKNIYHLEDLEKFFNLMTYTVMSIEASCMNRERKDYLLDEYFEIIELIKKCLPERDVDTL